MQQALPTVGDTITISRWIAAPAGAIIQARAPADSTIATLAAPPVLSRQGDSIEIAYTVAVWTAGHSDLILPGAIIVNAAGHVDTLADSHVALDVASVLPAGRTAATIAPRKASPWVQHLDATVLPFAVLVPLALIVIAVLQWQWRRRGPSVPPPPVVPAPPLTSARVDAWIAGGEARLVLDYVSWLARHRDDLADWEQRASAVRFAAHDDPAVADLAREGFQRLGIDGRAPADTSGP